MNFVQFGAMRNFMITPCDSAQGRVGVCILMYCLVDLVTSVIVCENRLWLQPWCCGVAALVFGTNNAYTTVVITPGIITHNVTHIHIAIVIQQP